VGGAKAVTECKALGRQAWKIFNENFCPVTQTISSVYNQLEGWKEILDFLLSVK